MIKQSLQNRIKNYFERHNERWINGGDIERLAMNIGYKASNASRRLRELAEDRILEREERKTLPSKIKSVWYKYAKKDISSIKKETLEIVQTDNSHKIQTLFYLQQI